MIIGGNFVKEMCVSIEELFVLGEGYVSLILDWEYVCKDN